MRNVSRLRAEISSLRSSPPTSCLLLTHTRACSRNPYTRLQQADYVTLTALLRDGGPPAPSVPHRQLPPSPLRPLITCILSGGPSPSDDPHSPDSLLLAASQNLPRINRDVPRSVFGRRPPPAAADDDNEGRVLGLVIRSLQSDSFADASGR